MSINAIIDSLKNYDKTTPVIRYLTKYTKYQNVEDATANQRMVANFIDKETGEVVLHTEVELLGIYYNKYQIWLWAWAQPNISPSQSYLSKKMLIHALDFDIDYTYLKFILITSRGIIKDKIQIDINLAIASDIIKYPYIYPNEMKINEEESLIYYTILINNESLDILAEKISSIPEFKSDFQFSETDKK